MTCNERKRTQVQILKLQLINSMEHSPCLDKLMGAQLVEILPTFMKPQGSLPCSQEPANRSYHETVESTPYPYIIPQDPV
jgi:hypothetical protein